MQPFIGVEFRQIFRLQEQVGTGIDHESEGALARQIKVHHHGGGVVTGVLEHMANIHLFFAQYLLQEGAETVLANPADKGAVAAQAGNANRHIGRRTTGTLKVTV